MTGNLLLGVVVNGTRLQYSCLENPMDGGAWQAADHGVSKSRTRLHDLLSLFTFMHWRRKWQPTPVFLPGESQGRGSLMGRCLWGHTELDTTEATQQLSSGGQNIYLQGQVLTIERSPFIQPELPSLQGDNTLVSRSRETVTRGQPRRMVPMSTSSFFYFLCSVFQKCIKIYSPLRPQVVRQRHVFPLPS